MYFFYTHSYAFASTCLTALANICRTSLNTTADSGHPCLVFHLSGSISNDSILHTTVALKLRHIHFPMFSNCYFLECFYHYILLNDMTVFLNLFICYIILMELLILNQPCIPGIRLTQSRYVISLKHCWILFATIFL